MPRILPDHAKLEREAPLSERLYLKQYQAAVYAGLPLGSIERLIADRLLKTAKVGKNVLVERASLERVMKRAQRNPIPGPRNKASRV